MVRSDTQITADRTGELKLALLDALTRLAEDPAIPPHRDLLRQPEPDLCEEPETAGAGVQLLGIQLENLGIDYIDRRNGLIESVTQDDVKRVAQRLLKPDSLIITVVGQPKGIEALEPTQ